MKRLIFIILSFLISYNVSAQEFGHTGGTRAKPVHEVGDAKTKEGALSFILSDSTLHIGIGDTTKQVATAGDSIIFGTVYTDTLGEATSGTGVNIKSDLITLMNVMFSQGSSEKSYWTDSGGDTVFCIDPNATAGPTMYFMDDTGADTVQFYSDGTDFKIMLDAGTGVLYLNDNLDVDGITTLDSTNVDGGELIVSHTDDFVSVGHDLIVADSLSVNGDQFVISDEDNTVTINRTVADTENPVVHYYYDADSDGGATSSGHLSISGTAAANPANSYITMNANDVGLGLRINGNVGIDTNPESTVDLSLAAIKASSYILVSNYGISGTNGFYNSNAYRCGILVDTQAAGGAIPWMYKSGGLTPSVATGGNHTFYIDDTTAVKIDSTRHVVLYSESNAGALANAEWYLTQGDQMNFASASGGYNFDGSISGVTVTDGTGSFTGGVLSGFTSISAASGFSIDITGTGNSYAEVIQDNNAGYLAVGRTTATEASCISVTDGGADNAPGFWQMFADDGNGCWHWTSTDHIYRIGMSQPADDDAGGYAIIDADDGTIGASTQAVNGSTITGTTITDGTASLTAGVLTGASSIDATNMSNGVTGEVTNWNTVKIYNDSTIAAETTLTDVLPEGYAIDKIIFKNTTASAITNLDIGFTDGGGEIVAAANVNASDEGSFTILQQIDDFDAVDTIYISAANWNSANLIIYIRMVRMF